MNKALVDGCSARRITTRVATSIIDPPALLIARRPGRRDICLASECVPQRIEERPDRG
ncbi:MAG: hypothetical protein MUE84_04840 [Hyphomonas sp.]|nr:hypothetical protein [Hyphomonas sp.]